ncbi:MAG TPA: hypothetical protein VFQ61_04855 [Polyangiaceae bacterium]|nr:hypothetical protein [Polyangiaceae bacterium]
MTAAREAGASEPVRLQWVRLEGAGSCIDASSLSERVRRRLGNDPFQPQAQRSIEGMVRREAGTWRAQIAVRAHATDTEPAVRELKSTSQGCESLGDAVVLAVALAIDPEAALAASASEASPPATQAPANAAPAPTPVSREVPARAPDVPREAPPRTSPSGRVAAGAVAQAGLLPHVSFGGGLLAAAALSSTFDVGVQARVFPAVRGSNGEFNFQIGAAAGALQLCAGLPASTAMLIHVCAGPLLGLMHAALLSGERSQPGERAWLGAELGADLDLRLTRWSALLLGARGVLPITRYRFAIEGSGGTIFRQAALAGMVQAALQLRFGAND